MPFESPRRDLWLSQLRQKPRALHPGGIRMFLDKGDKPFARRPIVSAMHLRAHLTCACPTPPERNGLPQYRPLSSGPERALRRHRGLDLVPHQDLIPQRTSTETEHFPSRFRIQHHTPLAQSAPSWQPNDVVQCGSRTRTVAKSPA